MKWSGHIKAVSTVLGGSCRDSVLLSGFDCAFVRPSVSPKAISLQSEGALCGLPPLNLSLFTSISANESESQNHTACECQQLNYMGDESEAAHTPWWLFVPIKANTKQGEKKKKTHLYWDWGFVFLTKRGTRQRKWQGRLEHALLAVWVAHSFFSPHFLPGRHSKKPKISTEVRLVEKWFGRIQD